MELSENRNKELAQKWAEGRVSPEEAREYLDWYNAEDNSPLEIAPEFATSKEELEQRMLATIQERISTEVPVIAIRRRWTRYVAAAAILLMIATGAWFFLRQNPDQPNFPVARVQDPNFKNDVLPGGDGAVLTLADGKQIVLDANTTGQLAQEGNTVLMGSAGELRYTGTTTETLYNTLTTRKGQQYALALSDGTKVWLNAGSSIRYPVGFTGDTRVVEITGEAYFEVASQPLAQSGKKPFVVKVNDMEVTVLGTHFNINSYGDEVAIRTTLFEGSVRVNDKLVLAPGQQSAYNKGQLQLVEQADLTGALAWKNGLFYFRSADIETVMRQVLRWYDIEVRYEGARTKDRFNGGIPRTASLTELLSILKESRVNFRLEGKVLTVLP
ncbi:MAG: hypothetical protein B7Z54_07360 [Sphingobacteriales bacterium 12-47-4]|nr:MAG: hypothetical protein B7Z54_07360 [Sphingobacteriales bacterium 12-47-4]